jgi:tetratricopeptide (TPR) repeat protein
MYQKLPISACLIVKNEEKHIGKCIDELKKFVTEIIVNDTGSTDNTIEILKDRNVHFFQSEWKNDFSYSRNLVIEKANQEWILSIDADEVLADNFHKNFRQLPLIDTDAFLLTIINIQKENELFQTIPHNAVRLFRNKMGFKFSGRIHEQISPSILELKGDIKKSSLEFIHYGYQDNSKAKLIRNLSILKTVLKEEPENAYFWYQLGVSEFGNNDFEQAKSSFRKALAFEDGKFSQNVLFTLYSKMGQIYLSENKSNFVHEIIEVLYEIEPNNPFPFYMKAAIEVELGEFENALKTFNEVLSRNQGLWKIDASQIRIDIGSIYYKLNKFENAIEQFTYALNENPKSELACYHLGNCFYKTHLLTEAKEMYEWAVKYKPDFAQAKSNLDIVINQIGS